jgi:hypothetical protein
MQFMLPLPYMKDGVAMIYMYFFKMFILLYVVFFLTI